MADEVVPIVRADAGRMIQVVLNLLSNAHEAILAERPEGRIVVKVRSVVDDGEVRVRVDVCDDGPGIPPAYLDRIFEPFFTTKDGGTGYGLYLASEILREHGGRLTAENLDERRRLPLDLAPALGAGRLSRPPTPGGDVDRWTPRPSTRGSWLPILGGLGSGACWSVGMASGWRPRSPAGSAIGWPPPLARPDLGLGDRPGDRLRPWERSPMVVAGPDPGPEPLGLQRRARTSPGTCPPRRRLAELVAPIRELQARFLALRGRLEGDRDDPPIGSDSGEMGVIGPTSRPDDPERDFRAALARRSDRWPPANSDRST